MCSRDVAKKKISKIEAAKFIFPSRAEQSRSWGLLMSGRYTYISREGLVASHCIEIALPEGGARFHSLGKTDTHTHAHNVDKAGFIVCLLPAS